MAKITFITSDNEKIEVEGESGSVMELAVENGVEGIDGDCGGVCSCATCHVHVASEDMAKVGPAGEIEQDMLELDDNFNERSRLCCQIEISDDIDGITLNVAH
ncbi:2Fe-2S iron-sulfur cluster binding domain-containing protein [Thalassotalea litorea]|uniref:2Fe-2S iron-sulfur cluster binding domain-containing protein n=1 Tax=Thalassotalea litorea TaxID=2020715 RepID=A0A5R9II36_9GAMM|nr:2Fe-2S iron-sulfur cluster-binding protein [Thalassotalea litorea]TLU65184.1 2Fe-2S iron-sulfur cluster binding domain-containing protein [Thalassotalea litorea]